MWESPINVAEDATNDSRIVDDKHTNRAHKHAFLQDAKEYKFVVQLVFAVRLHDVFMPAPGGRAVAATCVISVSVVAPSGSARSEIRIGCEWPGSIPSHSFPGIFQSTMATSAAVIARKLVQPILAVDELRRRCRTP